MDKALYIAMTGARATLQAQGTVSHNLANADTAGFKAALANTEAFPVRGAGHASRTAAMHIDQGFNALAGAQQVTGNPLDVSLQADRWLAVQSPDGGEAYTRAGNLSLTPNGQLVTAGGRVLGVTAAGPSVAEAVATAYAAVEKISFADGFFRRDIGWREIARERADG